MTKQIPLKTNENHFFAPFAHGIAWAYENKEKAISYALTCTVVIFCVLAFVFTKTKNNSQKQQDALTLCQDLEQTNNKDSLGKLQSVISDDVQLQKVYDPVIAQSLLYDQNAELDPWAEKTVMTLESCKLPLFANFAEVSRLSGKNMFKEALKSSLELKTLLKKQESTERFFALRAYNLIETSALCFRCREKKLMEENIAELKMIVDHPILENSESMQKIFRQLHCGPLSMVDFLQKQLTELE